MISYSMSFSDLLHKVKYYLGISVSLQIAIFNSFLWLGNISLCVYIYIHMCMCVYIYIYIYSCCCSVFATPRTAACQASLSLTISQSLPTFMSVASVMPRILSHKGSGHMPQHLVSYTWTFSESPSIWLFHDLPTTIFGGVTNPCPP